LEGRESDGKRIIRKSERRELDGKSDIEVGIEGGSAGDDEGKGDQDLCIDDDETETSTMALSATPMTSA
jgi:hypothetical protein